MNRCRYRDMLVALRVKPAGRTCTNPALYRTQLRRGDNECNATVSAYLCDRHDRLARLDEGWLDSWIMPRHAPVP